MNKIFKGKYEPLMIAEIGGNHEGNFTKAKNVGTAVEADVDVIKF